jgi:S1-C subfamily serine protease
MYKLLVLLLALTITSCSASSESLSKSVVRVLVGNGGGTGFAVPGYIMTAAHVCGANGNNVQIMSQALDKVGKGIVVAIDYPTDLCLIKSEMRLPVVYPIRVNSINKHVRVIGHPRLGPLTVTEGTMQDINSVSIATPARDGSECHGNGVAVINPGSMSLYCMESFLWQASNILIAPGSSGSPIFDDAGSVVGLINAMNVNSAYSTPAEIVYDFVKANSGQH